MSDSMTSTRPPQAFLRWRRVTAAWGFFSTAVTFTGTPVSSAAASVASTRGPRPAPSTATCTAFAFLPRWTFCQASFKALPTARR